MAQIDADNRDDNEQRDPQTYAIIGAAMEVHRHLESGFLERSYQDALEIEFRIRDIPFSREASIDIVYKGETLESTYRADFICYDEVLLETKTVGAISERHYAQVIHYLKATGLHRALLINFKSERLEYKRIVLNYET